MAIAFLSAGYKYGISTVLKSTKQVEGIDFTGAHQLDYSNVGSVFHTHRTGKVSRRISTIVAAKCHDGRFEFFFVHNIALYSGTAVVSFFISAYA